MKYYLAEACQNTFVLFDCREEGVTARVLQEAHRCLLALGRDDALLLTADRVHEGALYVEMAVLGWDGVLAEFCGNGARAIAAYLFATTTQEKVFLVTKPGFVCQVQKGAHETYSIALPAASFDLNTRFIGDAQKFQNETSWKYVEMLEPHLLINSPMSDQELLLLGQTLNGDKEMFPHGINVNAWHVLKDATLFVKTYERGVQRLTRSCGTGSAACAALQEQDVTVVTPGGELKILVRPEAVTLIGPAQIEKECYL